MAASQFDKTKPIAIGADHAGFEYKEMIKKALENEGWLLNDHGTFGTESVDYPDFAHPVADAVEQRESSFGILICGSGEGVCITANKHQGIRAALCWNNDVAQLSRQHNNANIICLPARFVRIEDALQMVHLFIETAFEGGRHENRVRKIGCS